MIKQHKWTLLITSLVTLVPMVAGLILWDTLPEQIATHWGPNGEPDGYSGRWFAVFGLPVLLLVLHWLCVLIGNKDNKDKNQKVQQLVLWICPVVSLFVGTAIYTWAANLSVRVDRLATLLVGIGLLIIGNYLPKCQQNRTIGIKIKWTLENEENWNATHRFSGRVWMLGGILFLVAAFLPKGVLPCTLLVLLPLLVVIPVLYSYHFHRKNNT